MAALPYALQLFSVRDYLEKNPGAALDMVCDFGYEHVEAAGFAGCGVPEFKALLDERELGLHSAHWGFEQVRDALDNVVAEAALLGVPYAVIPWLGGEFCDDKDSWLRCIEVLDRAGARLKAEGVQLCYHNHDHEFKTVFDGQTVFDMIYAHTAPEHLALELDLCWVEVAGFDAVAVLRQYAGRVPLVHVKDYLPGEKVVFTELGQGAMNFQAILPAAVEAGAEWYVVEQDESQIDSMESARQNACFMQSWE